MSRFVTHPPGLWDPIRKSWSPRPAHKLRITPFFYTLRYLKGREARTRGLLTEVHERFLEAGVNEVLDKGISFAQILAAVRRLGGEG